MKIKNNTLFISSIITIFLNILMLTIFREGYDIGSNVFTLLMVIYLYIAINRFENKHKENKNDFKVHYAWGILMWIITILSGLRLLNRIIMFNMGNWDIPLAIVVCLGVIITALVFIVFAKIEQS